eukprot:scaffold20623_cov36-Phaeocystis_antarctica.AAC.1
MPDRERKGLRAFLLDCRMDAGFHKRALDGYKYVILVPRSGTTSWFGGRLRRDDVVPRSGPPQAA